MLSVTVVDDDTGMDANGRSGKMENPFEGAEVISLYTNEQAIEDGIKFQLGEGLFATTALASAVAPTTETVIEKATGNAVPFDPRVFFGFAQKVVAEYNAQSDTFFTTTVDGHEVWVVEDGDGATLLRPEDY